MSVRSETETLVDAFEEDHRQLTRGLHRLLETVRKGDLESAAKLADQLDREVGAHIEFEESDFYPELREQLGEEFVGRLYDEHDAGKDALRRLLERSRSLGPEEREEIAEELETALEHALSCGTLLSHLDVLTEPERGRLRERLEEARERGRRWTELE